MKQNTYQHDLYTCPGCQAPFSSNCALSLHHTKSLYCNNYILSFHPPKYINPHSNENKVCTQLNNITNNKNNKNGDNNLDSTDTDQLSNDHSCSEIDNASSIYSGKSVDSNLFHYSNEIGYEIKLMKIITDIGAPLYSYKLLMQWAHEACQISTLNQNTKLINIQ
jgi:hypothetical protein